MTIFTRRSSGIFAPDPEPIQLPDQAMGTAASCVARLYRAKSGTLLKEWRFKNIVVDNLRNAWGTNTPGFPGVGLEPDGTNFFAAGTGVTPPTVADTVLAAEILTGGRAATTIITPVYVAGTPDYWYIQRRGTFSTSQANGTIGEFGWLSASSGGTMRARAVPKDSIGSQITITKTSATTLTLDWYIYLKPLQADVIVVRTVGGTSYTITARSMGCSTGFPAGYYFLSRAPAWGTGSGALGARSQGSLVARTGNSVAGTNITVASLGAYVNGTYERTITFTTLAMSAFAFLTNCGGNSADNFCPWQIGFSPSVASGQPFTCKVSWAPIP